MSGHRFGRNLAQTIARAKRMGVIARSGEHPLVVFRPRQNEENPMVRCPCGRKTQADMLQRHQGEYLCDGCWTDLRRHGRL